MKTHGASLDEESLNTLFVEVEGIVHSRPLVVETINDVNSQAALSPSHILTMKLKVVMPTPGMFGTPDLHCRIRWTRVQHISHKESLEKGISRYSSRQAEMESTTVKLSFWRHCDPKRRYSM